MTRSAFTVFSALTVPCDKATGGCGAAIGKRCTAKPGLEMAHCHTFRRKAADAQRTREVNPEVMKREVGKDFDSYCTECQAVTCVHVIEALNDLNPPDFLPMREPLPPRIPDLNADDEYLAYHQLAKNNATARIVPFFPEGAFHAIRCAISRRGMFPDTKPLRVEWLAANAHVIGYIRLIHEGYFDDIRVEALSMFPSGFGLELRKDIAHGPSTQWATDELAAHDAEKAIDEANWLAQSNAEIAAGVVPVDDGKDISFDRPAPNHNPETCRDPACECWPF